MRSAGELMTLPQEPWAWHSGFDMGTYHSLEDENGPYAELIVRFYHERAGYVWVQKIVIPELAVKPQVKSVKSFLVGRMVEGKPNPPVLKSGDDELRFVKIGGEGCLVLNGRIFRKAGSVR